MKLKTLFSLLCTTIITTLLNAQPKPGESGSLGSFKAQGFCSVLSDSVTIKNGHYELWYEGVKIMSGQYIHNLKDGLWKHTNLTGDIFIQGLFAKNKKTGAWKYYANQKLLCIIYYKNDLKDSLWQSFYENGKIQGIINYSNDAINGSVKFYYDNGNLSTEAIYKNDSIVGNYITYYKDSTIKTKIEYRNGNVYNIIIMNDSLGHPLDFGTIKNGTGSLKIYRTDGKKVSENNYVAGLKDGNAADYLNGKIRSEGMYKNNKKSGKWTYYDNDGKEVFSKTYNDKTTTDNLKIESAEKPVDILTMTEKMPSAQGGEQGMMGYIQKNLSYPEKSKSSGISGTVYLSFTINTLGAVSDITLLRGVVEDLNNEAIRIVNLMPPWTPGFHNGFPVDVNFNLPLKYSLR